jgi:AraC-like DNA-binding protein
MTIEKRKTATVGSAAELWSSYRGVPGSVALGPSLANTTTEGRVEKILDLVGYTTIFTVRDLALELHVSPSHLQRLFKHQTGVSLGEWLIEQRLQRAAHLLAHSYMSVKEIAHTLGYEHASSFVRAFGRRFAQAPARYRKWCDGQEMLTKVDEC